MPKAISVLTNQPQASPVEGPRLMTTQLLCSATVVIAVVGSYKSAPEDTAHPAIRNDKFLALLSTGNQPQSQQQPSCLTSDEESEEQREKRKETESHLLSLRQNYSCSRYLAKIRDCNVSHPYRSPEHFCATAGNCLHRPPPSTFPGRWGWTFASGAASFDAARRGEEEEEEEEGRRLDVDHYYSQLAPDVAEHDRALGVLGDMVREAVMGAGLVELRVMVSATCTMALENHGVNLVELDVLTSRVVEMVVGWVEEGWVGREYVDVLWRPFGTTRNVGILGPQSTPAFMIYDEE